MIVLLAVITDLLLPTKSMQKYVRMVMGLAVIAAMIQPLLPLLRHDWADSMAAAITSEVGVGQNTGNQTTDKSTRSVNANGIAESLQTNQIKETLASQQNETATDLLEADLAKQIVTRFRCRQPPQVHVAGTLTTPQTMRVVVYLAAVDSTLRDTVASWLTSYLGIVASQVTVE